MPPFFLPDPFANLAFWAAFILRFILELVAGSKHSLGGCAETRSRLENRFIRCDIYWNDTGFQFGIWGAIFRHGRTARAILYWIGLALMLGGVAFRWHAIRVLGKYFSREVAVQPNQTVVEIGPYRYIRHPAYTGMLLTFAGIGLALGNWASIAALLVCAIAGFAYRVRVEERALLETLGQPGLNHIQRTQRFIPYVI